MSYHRELKRQTAVSHPIIDFAGINKLAVWLKQQVDEQKLSLPIYLLAHATDGVIWGRLAADGLVTSYDALHKANPEGEWDTYRVKTAKASLPPLLADTVQQLRLFNEQAELFVWRDGDGEWHGCWLRDVAAGETADWLESFDEPQLLWGTHGTRLEHGFTLLEDGAQGLYHALPVEVALIEEANGELNQSVQLNIRHYLAYDEQGQAYVAVSRLVTVEGGE
jgi:CRISPR-associated protein (TIGR03984 family)